VQTFDVAQENSMALERFADTLRGVLHFDQLPFVQSLLPFATRLTRTPLSEQPERRGRPVDRLDGNRITDLLYPGSEQDREFRNQVKCLLADPLFAPREGLTATEQAQLSYARFRRVRDELDLRIRDVEYRPARLATALELIATVDGTLFTVMSIHYCLCGGSILRHGAVSSEIEAYIEELDSLNSIGAFLVTELGYGNNVVALQTRADYDPVTQEIVLSTPSEAARKFMPNTGLDGVPKLGVVMARLMINEQDQGVFPILVRLRTEKGSCAGVKIVPLGAKPGYSLDNAMTSFENVRVPKHCLLLGEHSQLSADGTFRSSIASRRERFLLSLEQVQLGRLCLSAVSATISGASSFIAIKYAGQRHTFAPRQADVPLLQYRNHQRDLFSALASAYASRLMVNDAIDTYRTATEANHDHLFRITSATKVHVSYAAERNIRLCRERCGAAALFEENRLSLYASQCPGMITAEGDNQVALIKVARQMLMQQGYELLDREKIAGASLDDPRTLIGVLRERERRLLQELRRAMLPAKFPGRDLFQLWNENINLAIETATAHASRLAAESFWLRVKRLAADDPLVDLFRLFAYQEITPHLGFLLAEGLITSNEVKNHRRAIDSVCEKLQSIALDLSRAFDIPNTLLRAPIASEDYIESYSCRARSH
jgi:acyl-CoA oxidase